MTKGYSHEDAQDVRGACILTVSDTLVKEESYGADFMSPEQLEVATRRMIEIALEAGTAAQ